MPTPAQDTYLSAKLANNIADYVASLYGTPPPENTDPAYMLVNEVPINWELVKRLYVTDRNNEGTYNASISYALDSKDHPIFTRDYIVRRANYAVKTRLSTLTGLVNATVTAPGSGYTFATVVLTGGTGSGGAITAIISNGKIVQLAITAEGNYSVAPALSIVGDGSGAGGTCAVQPNTALLVKEDYIRTPQDPLDGLYVLVRRVYETLPGPILSGQDIDKTTGIVANYTKQVVANGTVAAGVTGAGVVHLTIANGGSGFTGNPTLTIAAPPSGVTATATATFTPPAIAGAIVSYDLTAGGAGYTSIPDVSISDGSGSGGAVTAFLNGTALAGVTLVFSDSNWDDVPVLLVTDSSGTGTGATLTPTLTGTSVDSLVVDSGGTLYSDSPTVMLVGGGGTGATADATVSGGVITALNVTAAGSGYTSRPLVVITDSTGSGASGHSVLTGTSVASVTIRTSGSGYQVPVVNASGGTGLVIITAAISPTSVGGLNFSAGGSAYAAPTLIFSGGGGGSGAAGTAAIDTGKLTGVAITNAGTGYTSSPVVTVSGGGGTGARVLAAIGSLTYVEVEPQTSCKDLVMRTTVDLASLPAPKTYPISFRVSRASISNASIVQLWTDIGVAFGLSESTLIGGSGPALAYRREEYMTLSAYEALQPGAFSVTGQSVGGTLIAEAIANDYPIVQTFHVTPFTLGTRAGIVDLTGEEQRYGIWKVGTIFLNRSY